MKTSNFNQHGSSSKDAMNFAPSFCSAKENSNSVFSTDIAAAMSVLFCLFIAYFINIISIISIIMISIIIIPIIIIKKLCQNAEKLTGNFVLR